MSQQLKDGDDSSTDLIMSILLSHMFIALCFFFIKATSHGNDQIGQRFATITFYPMHLNETLLNSFIANGAFRNSVCIGVKQYAVRMFDAWTQGSISYQEAVIAKNTKLWLRIAGISIFDLIFLLSIVMTIIIIAINGSGRIRYNDILDEKGKPKKDRKNIKPKDILSMRFGEQNYKRKKATG